MFCFLLFFFFPAESHVFAPGVEHWGGRTLRRNPELCLVFFIPFFGDKSEMDGSLMYRRSNWLKLKQDEKGLHFGVAASLLMTGGAPPTAISAYYNSEMARLPSLFFSPLSSLKMNAN